MSIEQASELTPESDRDGFEWGIKYELEDGITEVVEWGYIMDPRLGSAIDRDGEVNVAGSFHKVISVGKRPVTTEVWEAV